MLADKLHDGELKPGGSNVGLYHGANFVYYKPEVYEAPEVAGRVLSIG